jgi:hypothetical protein
MEERGRDRDIHCTDLKFVTKGELITECWCRYNIRSILIFVSFHAGKGYHEGLRPDYAQEIKVAVPFESLREPAPKKGAK